MHAQFYIQKKSSLSYILNANDTIIGTIQENKKYTNNLFWKVFSGIFLNTPKRIVIENLRLDIVDHKGALLGYVIKGLGFNKDLHVYNVADEQIARIKSNVKMAAPSIEVFNSNNEQTLHATSSYGATDFTITTAAEFVTSIQKRSLMYESIKDNLFNYDVYHIKQHQEDPNLTLIVIAITVAIDLYFFAGE